MFVCAESRCFSILENVNEKIVSPLVFLYLHVTSPLPDVTDVSGGQK